MRHKPIPKEKKTPTSEPTTPPGGSFGATDIVENPMETRIGGPHEQQGFARAIEPSKAKVYVVERGASVVYDQCRVEIRAGKVLSESAYDIELLRSQGVVLKDITPADPEPEAPAPLPELVVDPAALGQEA